MISEAALRGYLLEESLAWLVRGSGYRLLVHKSQDVDELDMTTRGDLRIRGRGTTHQVDVLGEFVFTPAFSLPVRLFMEAKFYKTTRCGLSVIRNAHGVIHDINENFVKDPRSKRPRRRYQYCYALFSAGKITKEAQEYALAHQISLIDLSGASFGWLRALIDDTAGKLARCGVRNGVGRFPVGWLRGQLRELFTTAPNVVGYQPPAAGNPQFAAEAEVVLRDFAGALMTHGDTELILGFPAAPFILPLATGSKQKFVDYSIRNPSHQVRIRRTGTEWQLSPQEDPDAYGVTFNMPDHIEAWIIDREDMRRTRTRAIKSDFLSDITVYHVEDGRVRTFQLRYEAADFLQP